MIKLVGLLVGLACIVPFVPLPTHAAILPAECYCVTALRQIQGVDIPRGDANTQKPNIPTSKAEAGDVLIMQYPENRPPYNGHVGLILEVTESKAKIVEYNYLNCKKSYRTLSLADKSVRGVYRPSAERIPEFAPDQSIA